MTPKVNVQTEVRRLTSNFGDRALNFDTDSFDPNFREGVDQSTARVGVRYSPSPLSNITGSVIYNDRGVNQRERAPGAPELRSKFKGIEGEGEYLYENKSYNVASGFSIFNVNNDFRFASSSGLPSSEGFSTENQVVFSYSNIRFPSDLTWTLGLSFDNCEERDLNFTKLNPKLGLQWDITRFVRLRLAAFRTVKPPLVTNRTIQPTQVAGFNQFFDDVNGTEAWRYGAGLDVRLTENVTAGVEVSRRNLKEPVLTSDGFVREDRNESLYRTYLYWIPRPEWTVIGEFNVDNYHSGTSATTQSGLPTKVDTWSAPLSFRYFDPLGFFAGLTGAFVHQEVNREGESRSDEGSKTFFVLDAALGYRFPQRRGLISLELNNLFNTGFKYQDNSFREFREDPSFSRFVPERTILGQVTLNF